MLITVRPQPKVKASDRSQRVQIDGQTIEDVIDTFELLDDWEERYRMVIDLGRHLPALPEDAYNETNKVRGCTSQVWIIYHKEGDRLIFEGDSDAHIVKGLVAVLLLIFSEKTASEIMAIDAKEMLAKLGLSEALSPMRTNGLFSMVARIQEIAHYTLNEQ